MPVYVRQRYVRLERALLPADSHRYMEWLHLNDFLFWALTTALQIELDAGVKALGLLVHILNFAKDAISTIR